MPATTPAPAPAAAPELHATKAKAHRDPLTLSQQRFILALLSLAALIGCVFGVLYYFEKSPQASAAFSIISAVLVGNLRDAHRHYFPGGKADDPTTK